MFGAYLHKIQLRTRFSPVDQMEYSLGCFTIIYLEAEWATYPAECECLFEARAWNASESWCTRPLRRECFPIGETKENRIYMGVYK